MNTFERFPDFIDTDIRIHRGNLDGYTVTQEMMLARHEILLPKEICQGASILDLGCCIGSTGAWALDNGAVRYVGIELQKDFVDQAKINLSKNFPQGQWQVIESSIERFLDINNDKFDLVYAGGVIYSSLYYQDLLRKVSQITDKTLVIESMMPLLMQKKYATTAWSESEFLPIVEYRDTDVGRMVHENRANFAISSAVPSIKSLIVLLKEMGFTWDARSYTNFKTRDHTGWPRRFGALFHKTTAGFEKSTQNLYENQINDIIPWEAGKTQPWKFDKDIAKIFGRHAREHIPDYDKVIDLSVMLCHKLLLDPLDDKIIDVGCATGETINRLYQSGCCNLVGVDSSQDMLDYCDRDRAWYVCSSEFPTQSGPYRAVLCNWTLHFIQDKISYLQKIYESLEPGGFLFLTDKTQNHGHALELYHEFKRSKGVSDEEIKIKAASVQNIMFINPVDWYFRTLENVGFRETNILNAAPCFTSFVAFKPT